MAAGPTGDSIQDARARFRRGVQLYNEGSFEAALAEFNKAYQITPNYKILYNIAQTQFDLHDYVGASKNLEQYMKEGSREISEERRTAVNELNRKLEERIGQVEVTCNLDGAEIRVDDVAVGVSPLTSAVPVNAGPRRITAVKVGHPMVSQWVTVPGMEKKQVSLEIPEETGTALAGRSGAGSGRDADVYQASKKTPSRIGLITSSAVAGGCAIAAGVFGILALQAKNDFDRDLKNVPGNQNKIDSDRSKMKGYALTTDILAGATVLSAAAAVYFLFTDSTESRTPKTSGSRRSLSVAPTVGGMVFQGAW